MPNIKVKEHKEKYLQNKYILEKVFNPKEEKYIWENYIRQSCKERRGSVAKQCF